MSLFNRFGATANDVLRLLKNVGIDDLAALDVDDAVVSGQTVVEAALDLAAGQIHSWLPQNVRLLMDYVDLEIVEVYAKAGQTTVSLTLNPIKADTARIFVFGSRPNDRPWGESNVTFSIDEATGIVTLDNPLTAGDVVYASYKPDSDSATFSVPLLAEYVAIGAAANTPGRLFRADTAQFQQIQYYRDMFYGTGPDNPGIRGELVNNGMLPNDISRMRFWDDLAGNKTIGSVTKVRM